MIPIEKRKCYLGNFPSSHHMLKELPYEKFYQNIYLTLENSYFNDTTNKTRAKSILLKFNYKNYMCNNKYKINILTNTMM